MSSDQYRAKADALLTQAAQAQNLAERGRLIDEAMSWHTKALNAAGHGIEPGLLAGDEAALGTAD